MEHNSISCTFYWRIRNCFDVLLDKLDFVYSAETMLKYKNESKLCYYPDFSRLPPPPFSHSDYQIFYMLVLYKETWMFIFLRIRIYPSPKKGHLRI